MKRAGSVAILTKPKAKPSKAKTRKPAANVLRSESRVREIIQRLGKAYPEAKCALLHKNPFELLVATILSAQCTDVRVNMVTPGLFRKHPTPQDFAALRQEALEEQIRSTGFFRNKAKSIIGAAKKIVQDFSGKVPDTMEDL